MKKKNVFALMLMLLASAMLTFTSCNKDDDDDNNDNKVPEGVIGKWVSEGANVAPLLVNFLSIKKIEAEFKADNSYVVNSYTTENVKVTFTGVYTQTKSGVGNIWTITLIQSTPTSVTSEGIFEITVTAGQPRT